MDSKQFIKLKDLAASGEEFTIKSVGRYTYKMWDNTNKKMLVSPTYEKGYRKIYTVETDKGQLDLSASQVSTMLEGVMHEGRADVNGRTFKVRSNGKDGTDIRYFINAVPKRAQLDMNVREELVRKSQDYIATESDVEEVNLDDIPF